MSDSGGEASDAAACTAVLLSVPQQVAERIESFLTANGIACRIRLNTEMTPERLAEEYLKQSPGPAHLLQLPILGPVIRAQIGERLQGIKIDASEMLPVWDVLVRPEDLPEPEQKAESTPREPRLNVPPDTDLEAPEPAPTHAGSPVAVTELPWHQAWAFAERLNAAGIPAAVMAAEEPVRDEPMEARVVPVGVRPEDEERARAFLGFDPAADDSEP